MGSFLLGTHYNFGDGVLLGIGSILKDNIEVGADSRIWHYNNLMGNNIIGERALISSYCQIEPDVSIGDYTKIEPYSEVCRGSKVGKNCYLGVGVHFTNDKYPPSYAWKPSIIEDDVIICSHALIFPGITIHKRAVINAWSIVSKDVPEGEQWGGNVLATVARKIGTRQDYDVAQSKWKEQTH